jgi:polyisoprenoid-binding protein YceI
MENGMAISESWTDTRLLDRLSAGEFAGTWILDRSRSTVALRSRSLWGMAPVKGTFTELTGAGAVSPTGEVTGTLEVAAASIDTKIKKRDTHLRSADFFDSDTYPQMMFTARTLSTSADGRLAVVGSLQVRDQTRPITVPIRVRVSGDELVQLDAEITVDRSAFGLTWNRLGAMSMKNVITVRAIFARR